MGIDAEQLDAISVSIELRDKRYVIDNPTVIKARMAGQLAFTIVGGSIREEAKAPQAAVEDEDVRFLMERTGKSEDEVRRVLQAQGGDIAKAMEELSKG